MKSPLCFIISVLILASCKQTKTDVGDKAPSIVYQKSYPENYKIPNNKPIVLDFWATWCGPCVAGLIESKKFIPYYSKDIEFIAITDTTSRNVEEFIKAGQFPQKFIIDKDTVTFSNFKVTTIPKVFIIDKNGIIVWSGNDGREVNPILLDEFLKTGKIKPITRFEIKKRPDKDTTNQNLEKWNLTVIDKKKLDKQKSILVSKTLNDLEKGSYSNAPEYKGYLTCINYSLKHFCERADEYFPDKKLYYDGHITDEYDFIEISFGSFDSLNSYLANNYGIVFKKEK